VKEYLFYFDEQHIYKNGCVELYFGGSDNRPNTQQQWALLAAGPTFTGFW
jgi:hypothetical protein